ncbi:hypothetical protein AB205_0169000 [Aquarana catesbeiana]|uniref:Uncharacterized protein n=1 Tax=Aquarana catesbeiana TaxID=8400 RepID=A0A2G9QDX4_AQUCT|nr:hypothetical protein AB205_0169000 [Aquarana catesbeiana]
MKIVSPPPQCPQLINLLFTLKYCHYIPFCMICIPWSVVNCIVSPVLRVQVGDFHCSLYTCPHV